MQLFPKHFQPLNFAIHHTFEHGDHVVVIGHFSHRIIDTGRKFESDFAAICTIRDGKLASYNFLEDSFGLWNAFQHHPSGVDATPTTACADALPRRRNSP
jgi:ketosteroid isomerase-like protein